MKKTKFHFFCEKYDKQIEFVQTLFIIFVFIALAFLITQRYFLEYKVVLVEQELNGDYVVVKEIIRNGKISESIYAIDTTQEPADIMGNLIIETSGGIPNDLFLYNITP